jgi:hypothetical protein
MLPLSTWRYLESQCFARYLTLRFDGATVSTLRNLTSVKVSTNSPNAGTTRCTRPQTTAVVNNEGKV